MTKVNEIVICRNEYKTTEDWENAIKKAVMVLLDNNYTMIVRNDDKGLGIVVIEFDFDDPTLGGPMPYFLSYNEFESVVWDDEREEE